MSLLSNMGFLARLAVGGARLRCFRLVCFVIVGFPYLLALLRRSRRQPKAAAAPNPFTYRLQ